MVERYERMIDVGDEEIDTSFDLDESPNEEEVDRALQKINELLESSNKMLNYE